MGGYRHWSGALPAGRLCSLVVTEHCPHDQTNEWQTQPRPGRSHTSRPNNKGFSTSTTRYGGVSAASGGLLAFCGCRAAQGLQEARARLLAPLRGYSGLGSAGESYLTADPNRRRSLLSIADGNCKSTVGWSACVAIWSSRDAISLLARDPTMSFDSPPPPARTSRLRRPPAALLRGWPAA